MEVWFRQFSFSNGVILKVPCKFSGVWHCSWVALEFQPKRTCTLDHRVFLQLQTYHSLPTKSPAPQKNVPKITSKRRKKEWSRSLACKHTNITVLTYKKATKKTEDWNTKHNRRPKHNTPNLEALSPNKPSTILLSHVQQEYPKTVSPKRFSNSKLWSVFSLKYRCITKNLKQVLRNFKKLSHISRQISYQMDVVISLNPIFQVFELGLGSEQRYLPNSCRPNGIRGCHPLFKHGVSHHTSSSGWFQPIWKILQ